MSRALLQTIGTIAAAAASPHVPPRCTNLTGLWTDAGFHGNNCRVIQSGSSLSTYAGWGHGSGDLAGLVVPAMSFSPEGAAEIPATQSAILTDDCNNFLFCGGFLALPFPSLLFTT